MSNQLFSFRLSNGNLVNPFNVLNGNLTTGSFQILPVTYPTVPSSPIIVTGDPIVERYAPETLDIFDNIYKVEFNTPTSSNDWYINTPGSSNTASANIVSGSYITSSISNVYFDLENLIGVSLLTTQTNLKYNYLNIKPLWKNVGWQDSFVVADTLTYKITNISGITVPLIQMPYQITFKGKLKTTPFQIWPSGSCNASDCIVSNVNVSNTITLQNQGQYAYTAQASDARYLLQGSPGSVQSASWASQSYHSIYADTASFTQITQSVLVSITSASWASQSLSASWAPMPTVSNSSSWASASISASYAPFTQNPSASWSSQSLSASWVPDTFQASASWASRSLSSSWADTASFAISQSHQIFVYYSDFATTASYIEGYDVDGPVNNAVSASWASQSISASYVPNLYPQQYQASGSWSSASLSASYAKSASWAPMPLVSNSSSWASSSISASYADNAGVAQTYQSPNLPQYGIDTFGSAELQDLGLGNTSETYLTADQITTPNIVATSVTASLNGNADTATSASWASQSLSASYFKNDKITVDGNGNVTTLTGTVHGNIVSANTLNSSNLLISTDISTTGTLHDQNNSTGSVGQPLVTDAFGVHWSNSITASVQGTSSVALQSISASYVPNLYPQTFQASSSWASASLSASVAVSASYAPSNFSGYANSASWASSSISASWAPMPTVSNSSSWASSSVSASYAPFTQTYQASGSWASQSFSTSYAPTPNLVPSASWVSSATQITTADTASYITSSGVFGTVMSASFAQSASWAPTNINITASAVSVVPANDNALYNIVLAESSSATSPSELSIAGGSTSIISVNPSNGNFNVGGSITAASVSSSLFGTASWSINAVSTISSSTTLQAVSADFATLSQNAVYAGSSSWASASISASYALNATPTVSASWASQSLSASYAPFIQTYQVSGSWASSSISASYAQSASWAPMPTVSNSSSWASSSVVAVSASWASASISASYAPFTQTYQVSGSWASQSLSASWAPSSTGISASYVKVGQTTIDGAFGAITSGQSIAANGGVNVNNSAVICGIDGGIHATYGIYSDYITANRITASLQGTASWANSASWAPSTPSAYATSASWASSSLTASNYTLNASDIFTTQIFS